MAKYDAAQPTEGSDENEVIWQALKWCEQNS